MKILDEGIDEVIDKDIDKILTKDTMIMQMVGIAPTINPNSIAVVIILFYSTVLFTITILLLSLL